MRPEQAEFAAELIRINAPLNLGSDESHNVRFIVGSKWVYEAGTKNLIPRKTFERKVPFISQRYTSAQRNGFAELYNRIGSPRMRELEMTFCEPGFELTLSASVSHEGELRFLQFPLDKFHVPQITTGDIGRMMLINEMLIDDRMGNHRDYRDDLALAMIATYSVMTVATL